MSLFHEIIFLDEHWSDANFTFYVTPSLIRLIKEQIFLNFLMMLFK